MARVSRRIGIKTAGVRLPPSQSVGPAMVKFGAALQQQEFAKQADIRTQEAQQAAAKLNFERDGDGNLTAPALPLTEEGLLAPSIYDRAYTNMVGQRYLQQINIDTSERLNQIATENRFDPDAYRKVAEGYVAKVTELAPDMLKPDVNNRAQAQMVEHFNRIVREKSERDWTDSRNVQMQTMDGIVDEAQSAAVAGDDAQVLSQYMQLEANLLQGEGLNYWGEAYKEASRESFNEQMVSSYLIGDVIKLPNDEVAIAQAKQDIQDFIDGEGKVKVIRNGEMVSLDVTEAMPDEERRAIIGKNAITAANAREAGFVNVENARHQRQIDEFVQAFHKSAVEAEFAGGHADRDFLMDWYYKAEEVQNVTLMDKIRSELRVSAPTGRSLTEMEKNWYGQVENLEERLAFARQEEATRLGVDRFELLTSEQQADFNQGVHNLVQGISLPQTNESSRLANDYYETMYPTLEWHSEDQGGTAIEDLNQFIRTEMQTIGVIPQDAINYFGSIINNIDTAGGGEVMRMLSVFDTMRDTPALRGRLKTALGESQFAALAFIEDKMLPSQQRDTAQLNDVFDRANKGTLYEPWNVLKQDREAVAFLEQRLADQLESYNEPWFGKNGATLPYELRQEAINMLPGSAHMLGRDPSKKQMKAVADGIVEELLTSSDSRWRRDPLGLNANKAQAYGMTAADNMGFYKIGGLMSGQPSTGYSEYPPMYWAETEWSPRTGIPADEIHSKVIVPELQKQLNTINADAPLHAGKNVHLKYDAGASIMAGEPAFEMYRTVKGGDAQRMTTDMRWDGEPIYFYPQDAIISYKQGKDLVFELEQEGLKQRQKEIESMRIPNDRGIQYD